MKENRIGNPLLKVGMALTEKFRLDQPGRNNRELCQDLTDLAIGNAQAVKLHYGKKIADALLIFLIFAGISLIIFLGVDRKDRVIGENLLQRPGYGMGSREEELSVQVEGERETEILTVTVQEQKFTNQQVSRYLKEAKETLEQEIKGENPSLDEVREDLYFPLSLQEGAVTVSWLTFPYGMIGDDGTITGEPEEEGSIVEIQAILSCQGKDLVYETAACVYPRILTEKEQLWERIKDEVQTADEASSCESVLTLPDRVEGKKITWRQNSEKLFPLFLALTILLPLCIYVQKDQRVHEKSRQRKLQLALDYPELMWKMAMLLGAGLTIRGAFSRIATEYQKEQKGEIHYVYEEMLFTCREIRNGVSEASAYENFGKRCGLPRYIKLGSLLSQNLKKGSRGLGTLLEKEAASSMEERKNLARKLGEQAGTKMMLPMMVMFGIVLIILIVPAFLSF